MWHAEQEANLNGNQRLISPGNQASPGSSYLLRQWSASSSQNNAVHYVPANEVKVLCKIGEGAFGEVSLATVPIFGKVAIKWLKVRMV